jgi:hypothetical protein
VAVVLEAMLMTQHLVVLVVLEAWCTIHGLK